MILLFGDSLTEQGFGMNGKVGWASLLAADYSRRADVFNRGFFGYNSQHAIDLLPSLPLDKDIPCLFCTVYFGANDATTPGSRQYIEQEQFASNLSNIVNFPQMKLVEPVRSIQPANFTKKCDLLSVPLLIESAF